MKTSKLNTDLSLKYLAQTPPITKDKKVIIFLHGYGSNEEDLFELRSEFGPEHIYLSVQAPMPLSFIGFQWYTLSDRPDLNLLEKELEHGRKLLQSFIEGCCQKYETASDNVVLIGFSQGAIMSYELALRNPKAVRGIAALSGKIQHSLKPLVNGDLHLGNLQIFIGHGELDDRVLFKEAQVASELLGPISKNVEFHSYQNLGHSINMEEIEDLRAWMQKIL